MTFLVSWLVARFIALSLSLSSFGNDTHTHRQTCVVYMENLYGRYYCLFVLAHESTTSRNYRLSFAHSSSCVLLDFCAGSALFFSFSCIFARSLSFSLRFIHRAIFILDRGMPRPSDTYTDRCVYRPESRVHHTFIPLFHLCMLCELHNNNQKEMKDAIALYREHTARSIFIFRPEWEFNLLLPPFICCFFSLKNMCATPFLVFIFYFLQVFLFFVLFLRIISPGHIPSWCVTSHRPHLWNITWGLGGWWWEGCRLEYPHGWDWMAWFGCRNFAPALFEMSAKYIWASIFNLGLFLDQSLSSFDDKRLCALLY